MLIALVIPPNVPDVSGCAPVLPADENWSPRADFLTVKLAADAKYAHGGVGSGVDTSGTKANFTKTAMEVLTPHVLAEMALLGDDDEGFTLEDFEAKLAKSPYEMSDEQPEALQGWLTDVLGAASPAEGRVHYVNNPGNFGDALIACAG